MNKLSFAPLLALSVFCLIALATTLSDELVATEGEFAKCYDPPPQEQLCSVFPFRTSLSLQNETTGIRYIETWFRGFNTCPVYSTETSLKSGMAFLCYLATGVCGTQTWAIPKGEGPHGLLAMLNSQTLKDHSKGDPNKQALCKRTCNEVLHLIRSCDTFFTASLGQSLSLCSQLPDTNCIDGSNFSQEELTEAIGDATSSAASVSTSYFALFLGLVYLVAM